MLADGRPAKVVGVNVVGLRRAVIPPEVRETLHEAYRLLYRANLNTKQALERIEKELPKSDELQYLIDFIRRVSQGLPRSAAKRLSVSPSAAENFRSPLLPAVLAFLQPLCQF